MSRRQERREYDVRAFTAQGNIAEVKYSTQNRRLLVRFRKGSTYCYTDVPESAYEQLLEAGELQRTFNDLIRAAEYEYVRVHA
jgi:hypothetical protein